VIINLKEYKEHKKSVEELSLIEEIKSEAEELKSFIDNSTQVFDYVEIRYRDGGFQILYNDGTTLPFNIDTQEELLSFLILFNPSQVKLTGIVDTTKILIELIFQERVVNLEEV
jgi:hypothetical protein